MNYNSDVFICNMNIENCITNVFVSSTHFFRFLFLVIPQIRWDQEGQLLIFTLALPSGCCAGGLHS